MDQSRSRPRHDPASAAEARPLIIERPELAHPVRRVAAFVITLLAWVGWIAMWIPVAGVVAVRLGVPLERGVYPSQASVVALRELVSLFPAALGVVVLILVINGVVGMVYRRMAPPRPKPFVGMDRLATGAALDVDKLAAWQSARVLHVEHGPLGRVTEATIVR